MFAILLFEIGLWIYFQDFYFQYPIFRCQKDLFKVQNLKLSNLCAHQTRGHMGDFKIIKIRDLGMANYFYVTFADMSTWCGVYF